MFEKIDESMNWVKGLIEEVVHLTNYSSLNDFIHLSCSALLLIVLRASLND